MLCIQIVDFHLAGTATRIALDKSSELWIILKSYGWFQLYQEQGILKRDVSLSLNETLVLTGSPVETAVNAARWFMGTSRSTYCAIQKCFTNTLRNWCRWFIYVGFCWLLRW